MKKKLSIEEIEKSVEGIPEITEATQKTPLKFRKKDKKKRKWTKLCIVLTVVLVVLTGLGTLGYYLSNTLGNIFGENGSGIFNVLSTKQLLGESSGRVNMLLLGVGDAGHAGENLTDTIMVLSYDVATQKVAMISVPRDLFVDTECGQSKINATYSCGESIEKGSGPDAIKEVVGEVLDLPIHYYAKVNFTGFEEIIDAVGGVDIYVEKALYDPYYPAESEVGYDYLYIKAGQQHMDGELALKYARSRETTSDFDRARRQQQVIEAVKAKMTSSDTYLSISKITSIIDALGNNIKTDFDLSYLQRAIEVMKTANTSDVKNLVFDNSVDGLLEDSSSSWAGYILVPRAGSFNFSKMQAAAKNIFNDNSISEEAAGIQVLNGTSTSGLASSVADDLEGEGYTIVDIDSADSQKYTTTSIVDGSNGEKSATITALESFFGVKSTTGTTPSGVDIIITIGSDYEN